MAKTCGRSRSRSQIQSYLYYSYAAIGHFVNSFQNPVIIHVITDRNSSLVNVQLGASLSYLFIEKL